MFIQVLFPRPAFACSFIADGLVPRLLPPVQLVGKLGMSLGARPFQCPIVNETKLRKLCIDLMQYQT